jgi:hypothetical protein
MKKNLIEQAVGKLKQLISEVGEFNYNKTFFPNDAVAAAASQALNTVSNHTQQNTNEGSGKEKALELSQKKGQTIPQLKKLQAFFNKNQSAVSSIKQKGGPSTDQEKGLIQSWNLHGGDAGKSWVDSTLSGFHDENLRTKTNLRKAGGAGTNKGMGVFDTTTMDTTKQRIHR